MSMTDFVNRLANAKPVYAKHPFIEHGQHRLALEEYKSFGDPGSRTLSATFRVISSDRHAVNSLVAAIWQIEHAPRFKGDDCSQDINRAVDFVAKLAGQTNLAEAGTLAAKLADKADVQPAKGMVIDCTARLIPAKAKRDGSMGKPFTDLAWFHVTQSKEEIKAMRDRLDATSPSAGSAPTLPTATTEAPVATAAPVTTAPAQAAAEPVVPAGSSLLDSLL